MKELAREGEGVKRDSSTTFGPVMPDENVNRFVVRRFIASINAQ